MEDRIFCDVDATFAAALEIERVAAAHGEAESEVRARLVQADMRLRQSAHLASAARMIWAANRWAVEHDRGRVLARSHLLLARMFFSLGDLGASLEHAVHAVERLDATASAYAQVWHRIKLADALAHTGSMDAARERYRQAEQLAIRFGETRLHMAAMNNMAYSESLAGERERAWAAAERLKAIAAGYGYPLDPADLDTIGRIQLENGHFAEAEQTMRACIVRHTEGHYETSDALATYLLTLAVAQRGLGDVDGAQATLDRSRALCAERNLGEVRVRVSREQAELHAARGDYAAAFAAHKEFFVEFERRHSLQREAQARTRQAMFETAEARQEAARFREQARRDPLTGLHNRRYVDELLPTLLADAAATGTPLAVALVDLDHFKRINDTYSHEVGDQVLIMVARLLEAGLATVAPDGFVARMGGEEFLIALPGVDPADAAGRLDGLRASVRSHDWHPVIGNLPVTVSIGVAGTGDPAATPVPDRSALLKAADRNLYAAKHAGRDRVVRTPA